jgi:hypothetical protein
MTVWEMCEVQKWNVVHIQRALLSNGYIADDIKTAQFVDINEKNQAVFEITFYDSIEGENGVGLVYVWFRQNGTFLADF